MNFLFIVLLLLLLLLFGQHTKLGNEKESFALVSQMAESSAFDFNGRLSELQGANCESAKLAKKLAVKVKAVDGGETRMSSAHTQSEYRKKVCHSSMFTIENLLAPNKVANRNVQASFTDVRQQPNYLPVIPTVNVPNFALNESAYAYNYLGKLQY